MTLYGHSFGATVALGAALRTLRQDVETRVGEGQDRAALVTT